jgi:cytochrome c-type biogenesis protein CcmF
MIPEIGHYALVLALIIAVIQGAVPMIGAQRGNAAWMEVGRASARGQVLFVAISFAVLVASYVASDFSVRNVYENSHTLKPMLYKITGVWANHEGSMLLWVLILAIFGFAVAEYGRNLPPALRARVVSVMGMISVAFIAYTLFTSNPFLRLDPAPLEGQGLNPLLQDPGLALHPPFLYLGYVGFSVAFAFAIAALIEGRVDAAWARWVRPWTLAAWTALTAGVAFGSWWAYYELGWGGWWFWDPVENASFMPWLVGTALLHSAIVVEKRNTLKSWTILLAILTFSLSLLGAFLVRSGVLTSVHSFATDPARGLFILVIFVIVVGGSLTLYALRASQLREGGVFAPVSREGALLLNNLFLSTATALVLIGTLYPLVLDTLGVGKISVGEPFFNSTFLPIVVPMLIACVIGSMLSWKRADLGAVMQRLRAALVLTLVVGFGTWFVVEGATALAAFGMALATWLVAGSLVELIERIGLFRISFRDSVQRAIHLPRSAWGMTIAHASIGIMVAGITASSAWQTEKIQFMRPGDSVDVAGYLFTFKGTRMVEGPNYTAIRGTFEVTRDGKPVTVLEPEKRSYPAEQSPTTEAAIRSTWLADLYAVVGKQDETRGWTTRIYHNPLVVWIWAGAIGMGLGGLVSLSDRRHRVGAPRRARRTRPSGAAAPVEAEA